MSIAGNNSLQVIDNQNGSMTLTWPAFAGTVTPDSFNVYLNGALNQNVTVRKALVTGLQQAAYTASSGVVTPPGKYDFKVVAVKTGVEVAASIDRVVTVSPTTTMLVTPMRRIFPFPNTGLD